MSQPARKVTIGADRLRPWIEGFAVRHGKPQAAVEGDEVQLMSPDGARALIAVPFPPLLLEGDVVDSLIGHVLRERRVAAVLVRKGGFAVGVFEGRRLVASKVGSSYVQGRTKAGGWSQQRYARRRDNQSKKAYAQAADEAVRLLAPQAGRLAAVVAGGDQSAIAAVFDDQRLSELADLLAPKIYPVPDPRLRVLQAFAGQFLTVEIQLNEHA